MRMSRLASSSPTRLIRELRSDAQDFGNRLGRNEAFAIPYSWIQQNERNMNVTDRGDRSYWHVPVTTVETGKLAINMSKIQTKASLEPYRFEFKKATKA